MIDVYQLTSFISAFRVETEKESISPETVGKLLQDIVNLLATASSDTERKILDDWKHRASRTQSQARLNSDEAQPRTVGHNRKCRRWFSRKYYASVINIKEFYEDNIGKTFTGILSNALNKNFGRNH